MDKKIHHSNINNKGAKINTGGMGIRRKKERKNAYEMSRGKESDFERIEGEILRVRSENKTKSG